VPSTSQGVLGAFCFSRLLQQRIRRAVRPANGTAKPARVSGEQTGFCESIGRCQNPALCQSKRWVFSLYPFIWRSAKSGCHKLRSSSENVTKTWLIQRTYKHSCGPPS